MKSDGPLKHFILAFLLAIICYVFFYHTIEHRRTRKGPWQVTFTSDANGSATLIINEPKLGITNAQIAFTDGKVPAGFAAVTMSFSEPRPVPFDVPFGKCLFMDTTFLPGTVALRLFEHEIELVPRVLKIDGQEHPWLSESTITLHPVPQGATR